LMSLIPPASGWASLSQCLWIFLLLFHSIYYLYSCLAAFFPSSVLMISGLVFWWNHSILTYYLHSSSDFSLNIVLFYNLIPSFSLSPDILSSSCSSLPEWLSTLFYIWLKEPFVSRVSVLILCVFVFGDISYFLKLLFQIMYCLL
jgi:hypothetical protein